MSGRPMLHLMFLSFFQAVMKEKTGESVASTFELLRCKLTLFYDYWQMNEVFRTKNCVRSVNFVSPVLACDLFFTMLKPFKQSKLR